MSDASTSVPDKLDFAAALAAGWSLEDLEWEVKQERAADFAHAGDLEQAAPLWAACLELARAHFKADDPRLGTSLANAAYGAQQAQGGSAAAATYQEALQVWTGFENWIQAMPLEQRARSSLFHLRMEMLHRDKYAATARERLRRFGEESCGAIADLAAGKPPPTRGLERWRAEKPAIFGETRKFLSACLLLVSRPS